MSAPSTRNTGTVAVSIEAARKVLGDSIITESPQITPRACTKPRCHHCDRPSRLDSNGLCRGCQ